MSVQWSDIVFPGRKVKVKVKDKHEVVQCQYVSKLSYMTAFTIILLLRLMLVY